MADISSIDKALAVKTTIGRDDISWYDPTNEPFKLYGVKFEDGLYRRMPMEVAQTVNQGVADLSINTAGGRVCFATDSDCVAISYRRPSLWKMPHMALAGSAGLNLYIRKDGKLVYYGSFIPDYKTPEGYDSIVTFPNREMREIVIHMPLYCGVKTLSIGVQNDARVEKWNGYKRDDKPVVFYGSSITQGASATTPATDYVSVLSRRFDTDIWNLGFSGSAKGEQTMMDYIAGLDMSVFVYDYDHNAPTVEHLAATHYNGYRTVRDAQPDLPIIMCTRPGYGSLRDTSGPARRDVIAETYERALAEGDKNVYFVDGKKVYADFFCDGCTVDGSHPTDYGFFLMANAVGAELEKIFKD